MRKHRDFEFFALDCSPYSACPHIARVLCRAVLYHQHLCPAALAGSTSITCMLTVSDLLPDALLRYLVQSLESAICVVVDLLT